jgi:glycosyltransferase involved in cell wall biosynthesis
MNGIAGTAALKFDPRDPSAIAEVMHRLVTDAELRQRLVAAGPLRAAQFSWRTTAEGVLDALLSAGD